MCRMSERDPSERDLVYATLLGDKGSWAEEGLCLTADPDTFYPEKGGSTREAKRICRSCPVSSECLEYALTNDERFGVFGGFSERERRRESKRRAALGWERGDPPPPGVPDVSGNTDAGVLDDGEG